MEPQYKIMPDLTKQNCLTLHPNTAKGISILVLKKWFLRFGLQAMEIKLKTSSKIKESEVKLSVSIIEALRIPLSASYEIRLADNEIVLGPYMGILVASNKEYLDRSVQYLTTYLKDYDHIGGVVVAFSLEGINPFQHTVEGYIFNPETKEWEQGTFSYPAAVFKTIYLDKGWRNYFQTVFGQRMFNSYVFNKWEMFKWLQQVPELKDHLPNTILYKKPQDLEAFFQLHREIYVKPLNGSHGVGIYKVSKTGESFRIDYEEEGVHQEFSLANILDLVEFLKSKLKKKYMLQQAIDLISIEGRKIDFRIVLTKGQAGIWKDMIMVAKYGKSGSTVTNIKSGGSAELGETTLKKIFDLSDEEVLQCRKEILGTVLKAVQSIEEFGVHCGNLGVDIAIDAQKRVWIIEMNNLNPDPLIAMDVNNREIFYEIKRMNMLYAKRLAGFPENQLLHQTNNDNSVIQD